jgi:cell division protein FtsQ
MKKTLVFLIVAVALTAVFLLVGFIGREQNKTVCRQIEIILDQQGSEPLISVTDIEAFIHTRFDSLTGNKVSDLDLINLENALNSISCIRKADVYTSLKGDIVIRALQRKPVLRVINRKGDSFYIDREGALITYDPGYPVRLPVATGNIGGTFSSEYRMKRPDFAVSGAISDTSDLEVLFQLALIVEGNPLLKAQIDQIYLNQQKEIELVPKIGRQLIVLGDATNLETKLLKLLAFYSYGMKRTGWNRYKTIDVRFENQVVCTKK